MCPALAARVTSWGADIYILLGPVLRVSGWSHKLNHVVLLSLGTSIHRGSPARENQQIFFDCNRIFSIRLIRGAVSLFQIKLSNLL